MSTPLVSVRIVTYNHEQYIAQAIQSALDQETSFPFEIVIGEDFSTDETRAIVRQFELRNPEIVRVNYHTENRGRRFNFYNTLKDCKGKYIAILDGDDYWTTKDKLQSQIEYMESHPDVALCFHEVSNLVEDSSSETRFIAPTHHKKDVYTQEDMLRGCIVTAAASLFRSDLYTVPPPGFDTLPYCDWPFFLFLARKGDFHCIHRVMGVHRFHPKGAWTAIDSETRKRTNVEFYDALLTTGLFDEILLNSLRKRHVRTWKRLKFRKSLGRKLPWLKRIIDSQKSTRAN